MKLHNRISDHNLVWYFILQNSNEYNIYITILFTYVILTSLFCSQRNTILVCA